MNTTQPSITRIFRHTLIALGATAFTLWSCYGDEPAAASNRWPAFLGAGASDIAADSIPMTWSPTKNIAWNVAIPGYGQSSPVIRNSRVYLTSVEGDSKQKLHVVAYDLATGTQVWDSITESTFPEKNSVYISRAAPTPVVDNQGVYAYFESGDVVAVSHDGKAKWHQSLTKEFAKPTNEFGLSASPAQTADHVIMLIDDPATSYVVALNKTDGSTAWKTDRTARTSWSSPSIVTIDGVPQVVCSSAGSVDGYDAATGEQLWTFTEVGGNTATTPIDLGEGRFFIAASPGRRGENSELAKKSNGLMTVRRNGDEWKAEFAWKTPDATPSWASPMMHKGFAYWVNRVGAVYCLHAETGEPAYTQRIKQSAWATPVGIGDHVYIFGKEGLTSVLNAGSEFEVVQQNALWSDDSPPINNVPTAEETSEERRRGVAMFSKPTLYGVAVVNGSIVLRTGSSLFCVRE
ncbi:PQQ-binding-like beta-propeller repeat protein [Fuerstiella marisgermanici]|uniref:Outer membrane biogenesis protein n=1 Tax=Fuerstiella marisgermanici TaxID=1891926 RepID=A0A1P8W9J9_9PLAN|nr:PQQ-binding-like beta-propeller repeat protein [Fuerstiella marisgermanici]APZ90743.1 outer membrane biogenesis protein [Fuerstiella marisgermanici]